MDHFDYNSAVGTFIFEIIFIGNKGNMVSVNKNIILKLKAGDDDSFVKVYNNYYHSLFLFALKYLKTKEDAEEIVQNIYLKIWERRHLIDENLCFKSYLFQIALNDIFNFFRKKYNEKKFISQIKASDFITTEENRYDSTDLLENIDKYIEKFAPQQKLIFNLNRFEGLSYHQIAQNLNLSVRTIENQVYRGVKSLRDYIGIRKIA